MSAGAVGIGRDYFRIVGRIEWDRLGVTSARSIGQSSFGKGRLGEMYVVHFSPGF